MGYMLGLERRKLKTYQIMGNNLTSLEEELYLNLENFMKKVDGKQQINPGFSLEMALSSGKL